MVYRRLYYRFHCLLLVDEGLAMNPFNMFMKFYNNLRGVPVDIVPRSKKRITTIYFDEEEWSMITDIFIERLKTDRRILSNRTHYGLSKLVCEAVRLLHDKEIVHGKKAQD
jgi:hypothetical protein